MDDKIQNLAKFLLRINLQPHEVRELGVESILRMFDQLSKYEAASQNYKTDKKQAKISDLRPDKPIAGKFRPDLSGRYLKVPRIIKT